MKNRTSTFLVAASWLALAIAPVSAQVVTDGATNTLSNVTNSITGGVTVGTNGSFTLLALSNNALLTNSANGVIGLNLTAKSNEVRLTSGSARWLMGGDLIAGNNGSFNQLVVSNGAFVSDATGIVGSESVGGPVANSNIVVVTGAGSLWTNAANFYLGYFGAGNQLLVRDGGVIADSFGIIGASSDRNVAVVTGPGSTWLNSRDLWVGQSGHSNRLTVSDGGLVVNSNGIIGLSLSRGNETIVTGAGSLWSNRLDLTIGSFGAPGNRLVISNSGTVVANQLLIGADAGSTNNRVVVDGGTLRVMNLAGNGTLDVRYGTNVLNAGLVEADRLVVTNPAGRFEFNSGTLVTRGALITNGLPFVVGGASEAPAIWDVRAGAFTNFVSSGLFIGTNSSFNQMFITNGAVLTNSGSACVGCGVVGSSNTVTVSGSGSKWQMGGGILNPLDVGDSGDFNRLVVENGARVEFNLLHLGKTDPSGGSNNSVLVTGSNSVFSSIGIWALRKGTVTVSNGGSLGGNRLEIYSGNMLVAAGSTASFYRVAVDNGNGGNITVNGGYFSTERGISVGQLSGFSIFTLNAGVVEAEALHNAHPSGRFVLNGGTLRLTHRQSFHANGSPFIVGDGTNSAVLEFQYQSEFNYFSNGIVVLNNGILSGKAVFYKTSVFVAAGGTLSPGIPIGEFIFDETPSLSGTIRMDISKSGTVRTHDVISCPFMFYGGSLIVSDLGPTTLAAGDNFKLFGASSYGGSFASVTLPPLNPGLGWTNKLLVDGSIEVVAVALSQPKFENIILSDTNVILSGTNGTAGGNYAVLTATNVTTPLSNWESLFTNQFGAGGSFSFTNAIMPGEFQRYFRLRVP